MGKSKKNKNKNTNRKSPPKKAKAVQGQAKISSATILIGALLLIMIGGGVAITLSGNSGSGEQVAKAAPAVTTNRASISDPVDFSQGRVDMSPIEYTVEGDSVKVSVAEVVAKKLVSFAFLSPEVRIEDRNFAGRPELPMMAMVSPSGKLTVGVSYCEPCRGTTFHTEEDGTLTCNSCGTKWDAETLEARSGACGAYPPDEIEVTVEDGQVLIPKSTLESWEPRAEL